MQKTYKSRSPAICQASQEGGWIVGSKNDADYMDIGGTVKARRRQVQFNVPFGDVFSRPYYLGVDLIYLWCVRLGSPLMRLDIDRLKIPPSLLFPNLQLTRADSYKHAPFCSRLSQYIQL